MAAVLDQPKKKRVSVLETQHGSLGFRFSHDEMKQLLELYYFGEGRAWASRLDRLDSQDRTQKVRGIQYDSTAIQHGNPLLAEFTHEQVDWAIRELSLEATARGGGIIVGWLEYCLLIWLKRTSPKLLINRDKPLVRDKDIFKAVVRLSQLLSQARGRFELGEKGAQADPGLTRNQKITALMNKLMGK